MTGTDTQPRASVTITRILDAPIADVWAAWTQPERLKAWWGPSGYTNPVCEVDLRVGGAMRIVMRAPDGSEHPMTATYREIVDHQRIVWFTAAFGPEGETHLEGLTTITFADQGGKTSLSIQADAVGFTPQSAFMLSGMEAGWKQSIVKLAALFDA